MGAAIFDIARTLSLAAERQAGTGAMPVREAPGSSIQPPSLPAPPKGTGAMPVRKAPDYNYV